MEKVIEEIMQLVKEGKKIEAIKLAREKLNVELQDAKNLVDALDNGGETNFSVNSNVSVEVNSSTSTSGNLSDDEIEKLLSETSKLNTIKIVKETNDIGLKEAKEYVDRIEEKRHRDQPNSSSDINKKSARYPHQEQEENNHNNTLLWVAIAALAALLAWIFMK